MLKPEMRITRGGLSINESSEAETIEQQIERMVTNKEPIKDGAKLLFTERQEGVRAEMNIRTDRWEVAIEATEKIARSYKARREERQKAKEEDGKTEPIQGTTETKKTA